MCPKRDDFSVQERLRTVERLLAGEELDVVSHELGVAPAVLTRWRSQFSRAIQAAQMPSSEELKVRLAAMAEGCGYTGRSSFSFLFPEIASTPRYEPDCVWFLGPPSEASVVAIFEADTETSRKHRVGGVALANVVALKHGKRLHYFAVVPARHVQVATTSIEILRRYLGDRWLLAATVIPSFDEGVIREHVLAVLRPEADTLSGESLGRR